MFSILVFLASQNLAIFPLLSKVSDCSSVTFSPCGTIPALWGCSSVPSTYLVARRDLHTPKIAQRVTHLMPKLGYTQLEHYNVSKDGIFKSSLVAIIPFTISITSFYTFPLEPGMAQVSNGNKSKQAWQLYLFMAEDVCDQAHWQTPQITSVSQSTFEHKTRV